MAFLELFDLGLGFGTNDLRAELDFLMKELDEMFLDWEQAEFRFDLALWSAEMADENDFGSLGLEGFDCWETFSDSEVVFDLSFFV